MKNILAQHHYSRKIIVMYLIIMLSQSCSFVNTYRDIQSFETTPVIFPSSGIVIKDGLASEFNDTTIKGKTFFIFIDSTECTDCRLSKMRSFDKLIKLGTNTASFDMVCIIMPPDDQKESVMKKVVHYSQHDHMMYVIDTEGSFCDNNPIIAHGRKYHYFLINEDKLPVFIGNPTDSDRMFNAFIEALL